jgi:hypothetical protein
MKETAPKKSSRQFTKLFVLANLVSIWALMILAVIYDQAEHVIGGGFALIGTMFGIYTGVGHLDFRKAVELSIDQLMKGQGAK